MQIPTNQGGRPEEERLHAIELLERLRDTECPSLEPYLPLLLRLRGKPYTLKEHFPFGALFRTREPRVRLLKTGRQVSKTTYLAASSLLLAAKCPYSIQLFITPLFEQIRRFSVNFIEPFIDESNYKSLLVNTACNQSVLQRTFVNRSMMHFSYAYLSSNRIRGIGGVWQLIVDETQDMDICHLPIIKETMSAAPPPWGITKLTGTPKGHDNPLQKFWEESSQAIWVILCPHASCGHANFCSTEFDLIKMIGPLTDDIGPAHAGGVPATVCAKCQKPVDPATGFWKHRYPERRWLNQGVHVPQCIMPMHYRNPVKWGELLTKMQGRNNVAPHVFHNEVLGEAYDIGSRLLTKQQLTSVCTLPIDNNPKVIPRDFIAGRRTQYVSTALGIDWGGGGGDFMTGFSEKAKRKRVSFTSLAFMGITRDGKIEVPWGTRLLTPNDHAREAAEVMVVLQALQPNFVAHDFTGAGTIRETLLVQAGVPAKMFIGIDYKSMPSDTIMKHIAGDQWDKRPHWRVDKTRTLQTTINAIKFGMMHFFRYDNRGESDPGVLDDLLALTEEKVETMVGDRYLIRRTMSSPDDFAMAVNCGACTLWHHTQKWPDFIHHMKLGPADVGDDGGWAEILKKQKTTLR